MLVGMMDSDFNFIERNYDRKYLQIDNIYCPVGNRKTLPSYMPLKKDIEKNGMKHPVIVIDNTELNYQLAIRQVETKHIRKWNNSYKFLCMYGNQRISIMRDLTHSFIPSFKAENVEWAHAIHLALRNIS